ncbi:MAG TPA: patatin-like phospholipase family protein [Polyangiales bacterium]|nr:patatin-like phospholipase family protein [Polyangiales bacterium]
MSEPITGVVMSGGGARAAYQVGALRALCELIHEPAPFKVLAGTSAGAINSTALAVHGDDFRAGVAHLIDTWRGLTPEKVYRTDLASLGGIAARWVRQLGTGGLFGEATVNALLDTRPLRALLEKALPTERIRSHIWSGHLRGVAVTATSYHTGTAMSFFEGASSIKPWVRSTRLGINESITVAHVLASSAIPMFFPPVEIDGAWYGDGCVRLSDPLSPAIHLGAERLVAIGIRYARRPEETDAINRAVKKRNKAPAISEISGVMLNAIFLDSLDADAERLERINAMLSLVPQEMRMGMRHPLRKIPLLVLRPSRDLGSLAIEQYRSFPRALRHLLRGIGATGDSGWDLVSYLAFEPAYIERLMDLGYEDTYARKDEIAAFFAAVGPF